jgi:hypothetical protein
MEIIISVMEMPVVSPVILVMSSFDKPDFIGKISIYMNSGS